MAGAAGAKGSSLSTGPREGLGAGQRDGGTPEDVKFDTKKLPANELGPGELVGALPVEGEAPKGEARLPVRVNPQAALQRMAQKIDSEALPAEYRRPVEDYMNLLRGAVPEKKSEGGNAEEAGGK
jgi:hypothetical protein